MTMNAREKQEHLNLCAEIGSLKQENEHLREYLGKSLGEDILPKIEEMQTEIDELKREVGLKDMEIDSLQNDIQNFESSEKELEDEIRELKNDPVENTETDDLLEEIINRQPSLGESTSLRETLAKVGTIFKQVIS